MKLLPETHLQIIKLSHILKNFGSAREGERQNEIAYYWLVISHSDAVIDRILIILVSNSSCNMDTVCGKGSSLT